MITMILPWIIGWFVAHSFKALSKKYISILHYFMHNLLSKLYFLSIFFHLCKGLFQKNDLLFSLGIYTNMLLQKEESNRGISFIFPYFFEFVMSFILYLSQTHLRFFFLISYCPKNIIFLFFVLYLLSACNKWLWWFWNEEWNTLWYSFREHFQRIISLYWLSHNSF